MAYFICEYALGCGPNVYIPDEPVISIAFRFLHLMTVKVIRPAVGK
jgi:hypothetical protein